MDKNNTQTKLYYVSATLEGYAIGHTKDEALEIYLNNCYAPVEYIDTEVKEVLADHIILLSWEHTGAYSLYENDPDNRTISEWLEIIKRNSVIQNSDTLSKDKFLEEFGDMLYALYSQRRKEKD